MCVNIHPTTSSTSPALVANVCILSESHPYTKSTPTVSASSVKIKQYDVSMTLHARGPVHYWKQKELINF